MTAGAGAAEAAALRAARRAGWAGAAEEMALAEAGAVAASKAVRWMGLTVVVGVHHAESGARVEAGREADGAPSEDVAAARGASANTWARAACLRAERRTDRAPTPAFSSWLIPVETDAAA